MAAPTTSSRVSSSDSGSSSDQRSWRASQCINQGLKCRYGRGVGLAIDQRRAKMALEGCDHLAGLGVEDPCGLHPVAIEGEHGFGRPHGRAFLLMDEERRADERRGFGT